MARTYHIEIDSYIGYPISKGYVSAKLKPLQGKPCNVRINSYGGDVMTALDIRQQFIDHGQVTAYIVGMTASAATILAMGAKRVVMSRYALMLVHPCSELVDTFSYYNRDELEKVIADLRKLQSDMATIDRVIASIYAAKSGHEGKEMATLMNEARWITAEEALKYGLIDAIDEDNDQTGAPTQMTNATREHFIACGLPLPEERASNIDNTRKAAATKAEGGENEPKATENEPKATENEPKTHETMENSKPAAAAPEAPTAEEGVKVGVIDQLISVIRNFFKGTGAPENTANTENSTKTVEPETTKPATMNETKLSPVNLCKVLAVESLSVDKETGKVDLTTQQVEVIDTYIKEALEQVNNLKQEKAELEKTINSLDGDTTSQAMPTNASEETAIPGAEAVDFYKKFNGLI